MNAFSIQSIGYIVLYGLLLNAVWEYAQLVPLYDCWGWWNTKQKILYPLAAILGDGVIVLGVALAAHLVVGSERLLPPDGMGWLVLLSIGFVAGVMLEWAALALGLWSYKPAMPTLKVGGRRVGLAPILQITLLPALSVYLATELTP